MAKVVFLYLPFAYIVLVKISHTLMPDEWSIRKGGRLVLSEVAPKWVSALTNLVAVSLFVMLGYGYAHWVYFKAL